MRFVFANRMINTFTEKKADSNMAHLTLKKLLAFHYDQLSTDEKDEAQSHLDACDSCSQSLAFLVKPEQTLKIKPASTGTRVTDSAACLAPEDLDKYFNHQLLPAELPRFEKHLAVCENCRQQLVALAQPPNERVSEETREKIEHLPPHEISEHVAGIQKIIRMLGEPSKRPVKVRSRNHWLSSFLTPRPAFVTVLLLIVAGKFWLWPLYRYDRLVAQGETQLLAQHKIHYLSELRPAGGFHSSVQILPMGAEDEKPQNLEALLRQALTFKPKGQDALRNLARYYLLEKRLPAADSVLKILEAESPHDAAVRHDRGCWFYQSGQYEAAASAFAAAYAANPQLEEALYNLAITQKQLGDLAAARRSWEAYLARPNLKPEWRNAAKAHVKGLQ